MILKHYYYYYYYYYYDYYLFLSYLFIVGTLFEELGFYYVGPVDAHNLDTLVPILENIRDNVPNTKPVLLHVKSIKGKGTLKGIVRRMGKHVKTDTCHVVSYNDVMNGRGEGSYDLRYSCDFVLKCHPPPALRDAEH